MRHGSRVLVVLPAEQRAVLLSAVRASNSDAQLGQRDDGTIEVRFMRDEPADALLTVIRLIQDTSDSCGMHLSAQVNVEIDHNGRLRE